MCVCVLLAWSYAEFYAFFEYMKSLDDVVDCV